MITYREYKVISTALIMLLIAIALIALAEKGPPAIAVFRGASPFNTGPIGTYSLYTMIRGRYPHTHIIESYDELQIHFSKAKHCLFITISPEKPYSEEEARRVIDALTMCDSPSIIVADERDTSNTLLRALGTSLEVVGNVILDPTGSLYPIAVFTLTPLLGNLNKFYTVRLDIASSIAIGSNAKVIGYVMEGLQSIVGHSVFSQPIAAYEELYRDNKTVRVIVIGDGSIFLNQVLREYVDPHQEEAGVSSQNQYCTLIMDLVDALCGYEPDCTISIDGTRYPAIPLEPSQIFSQQSEAVLYTDMLHIVAAYILRLVHPSTWLPPAISYMNTVFRELSSNFIAVVLISAAGLLPTYLYLVSRFSPVRDHRLGEVSEVEYFVTADIRNAIMRGAISLDKYDFIRLFTIVDTILKAVYGCSLCSSEAEVYIAKALNSYRDSKRFVERMCRLYRKASRGGILPIVLSWHRVVMRSIKDCERVLKALGVSLMEERGFEYKLLTL